MTLSPMRFKTYVWPHNPRIYEIDFHRRVAVHKVPFGYYTLEDMGRTCRVMKGEGEFCGEEAYREFQKLACLFYDGTPGLLTHPLWQTSPTCLVSLSLRQEPTEDYVAYSFEFWEDYGGYSDKASGSGTAVAAATAAASALAAVQKLHTVAYGESLWSIAAACGISAQALTALNPQMKNPNLLKAGDVLRTA